jgi:uncharacterized membrane protein YedE/YeeE
MKKSIITLIAGCLFGIGLTTSGMTDPKAVIGFLSIFGEWDARLLFVMGGAVITTLISFHFILKRKAPIYENNFSRPIKSSVDNPLIMGAILFGIGWGLSGYCPGPAIAGIVINPLESIIFIFSMLIGMFVFKRSHR